MLCHWWVLPSVVYAHVTNYNCAEPELLPPTVHPRQFAEWGICPGKEAMTSGYKHILTAADHFSKWSETILVHDFTNQPISEFVRIHIIYIFATLTKPQQTMLAI